MSLSRFAPALNPETCHGTFTIDGESMQRGAFAIPNLSQLYSSPGKRGSDLVVADDEEAEAHARRQRLSLIQFRFAIVGAVDRLGVPFAVSAYETLAANRLWLGQNIVKTPATDEGTRTAVFTPPGMSARTAEVHVTALNGQLEPGAAWRGTLTLELINGNLYLDS